MGKSAIIRQTFLVLKEKILAYDYASNLPSKPERAAVNLPRDSEGNTYLHELIRKDAPVALIREALDLGANVNAVNKKNMPPLGMAIQQNKPEVIACLIDGGAEMFFPVAKDTWFNAVYMAADTGRDAALKTVLDKGGGLYVNNPGMTQDGRSSPWNPLHIAVKTYHYAMVAPLVAAGAFLNDEAGYDKATPLFLAATNNDDSGVATLINAGADLERRNSLNGRTALAFAVADKDFKAARALVHYGADVNAADNSGMTPLMYAADNGDMRMAELLLAAHADVNARRAGNNSETALMKAARKGASDVVKALLKAGADPLLSDSFNKTALRYAEDGGYNSARYVLEEAEQKAIQAHFENSYRKYRP